MMRKAKKQMKNTTDSRVYKMALRDRFLGCPICGPNQGCNRNRTYGAPNSWKNNRDNQWKE